MKKILLVENQWTQYYSILTKLGGYDVYPSIDKYKDFIEAVKVFLSNLYIPSMFNAAQETLQKAITENHFDLYIIDYKLTGNDDGFDGIYLADKLRAFKGSPVPVLLLSGHLRNEEKARKSFKDMFEPKEWVEKGYAYRRILESDYFDQHVIPAIVRLLGKSESEHLAALLQQLEKDARLGKAQASLHLIRTEYDSNGLFPPDAIQFLKELDGKKGEYSNVIENASNRFIENRNNNKK